ncbi:MFS general substrate transporter [Exidia glandulosa HHB12029]|uniref:MFS general substrate transporter n=1 Tax=Exidia glandulosa HHB12029 TaxID=1314781 RepID=A0A165E883_EXIGL|nr:MFS general substrate transporter [Exidia glandulosa HHB12029]
MATPTNSEPTTPTTDFELNEPGASFQVHESVPVHPPDRGAHAYAYLFASFIIELLAWSLPFSYGVFLNYYTDVLPEIPSSKLAVVGTLSTGVMYLAYPVVLRATTLFPHRCRQFMAAGLALCVAGLLGAAWSTKPWHFIMAQGLAYSIGGALLSFPSVAFLFEWFPARRGLAMGILFSGTGIGGIVMPFAIDVLLRRLGQRDTFLIITATFAIAILPCFAFIKPRLPPLPALRHERERLFDVSFLANGMFWPLFICSTLQGLANFVPGIYLPSYSSDIGLSNAASALVAALINGASVPGAILIGWATDRYALSGTIVFSTAGAATAVFLLWGFARGLAQLAIFAIVYGFCAGGFSAMWPRFASAIAQDDHRLATTVYSLFGASRGIGNILAGPISSALLHARGGVSQSYGARNYGPLILFTGATMLASACGSLFGIFGPRGRVLSTRGSRP